MRDCSNISYVILHRRRTNSGGLLTLTESGAKLGVGCGVKSGATYAWEHVLWSMCWDYGRGLFDLYASQVEGRRPSFDCGT